MDMALQNFSHNKSKNFAKTNAAMPDLEVRVIEYRAVIGSPPDAGALG